MGNFGDDERQAIQRRPVGVPRISQAFSLHEVIAASGSAMDRSPILRSRHYLKSWPTDTIEPPTRGFSVDRLSRLASSLDVLTYLILLNFPLIHVLCD
jgi:hypothetical protein